MRETCYDTVIISDLHLGSEVSRDDRIRPWLMKRTVKQMRKLLAGKNRTTDEH